LAGGPDGLTDLDLALVHRGGAGGRDGLGDLGGGDGAEEPARSTGPSREHDLLGLERVTHGLRVVEARDLARLAGGTDRRDLLLGTLGPRRGQLARHEVVTGVPVLDLDHVTGLAEAGDLVRQDE